MTVSVSPASTDDADLLARYGQGDLAAARTLSDRLTPRLLAFVMRTLGDRAESEDVTQEVMLRLWKIAPDWQDRGVKVSSWAFRVALNLATDRLRRRRQVSLDQVAEPLDPTPGVDAVIQTDARVQALRDAIAELPERQGQAILLRHIEGLSNPEIAAIMDIGVEAVESLSARGRAALKKQLAPQRNALGFQDDE